MKITLAFNENYIECSKKFIIALITLIVFDIAYLKTMNYNKLIEKTLIKTPINVYSAIFTWSLIALAIAAQHKPKNYKESLTYGMFIGLIIYGVYNGTNFAIFKNYPLKVSIIDTLWGIFVCGLASLSVYYFYHHNNNPNKNIHLKYSNVNI